MILYVLISVVLILGILVLLLSIPKTSTADSEKKPPFLKKALLKIAPWLALREFYARGKEAGFSPKEIGFLKNSARQSGIRDYAALFQEADQLDSCIRSLLWTIRLTNDGDPEKQDFLSRLYECRKKISLAVSRPHLTSSREIKEGQNLRIVINYSAIYQAAVLKNAILHLLLTRPVSPNMPTAVSWKGKRLSAYFWNEGDAGYVFDCTVLDEVFVNSAPTIQISHSNSLFRTQNRKSVRMKIHAPSFLSIIAITKEGETAAEPEAAPALKCLIEDLSDGGCLITVGGRAARGLRIKIQFVLENKPVTMIGTVRGVEYDEASNRSQLHIAADPLPLQTKNFICGAMFGMPSEAANFSPG